MRPQITTMRTIFATALMLVCTLPGAARNTQAPDWMHALTNVPLPAHDEKTDAVMLYSEDHLSVVSTDNFRTTIREAYKILRPEGRDRGKLQVEYNSLFDKIVSIHAWCIPATGKDYGVTEKDSIDRTTMMGEDMSLVTSFRFKELAIPAPDPGNIIGYEYVIESKPEFLQDYWEIQGEDPVRETHYSLTLPAGWNYRTAWSNYPAVKADEDGSGTWKWSASDVKGIREEEFMPPAAGLAAFMVVTLYPPGATNADSLTSWQNVGKWYQQKSHDALISSPEINQEVAALTASTPTLFGKMQAIAEYIQQNIRYVSISLKIGGMKPHPAPDVFAHRYGDCKDKSTLMQTMLKQIGVESYYVFTNDERDAVTAQTPPHVGAFDHAIIAIKIPDGLSAPNLVAIINDSQLGRLLIFDPTNEKTPLGEIGGYLQANYSLISTPSGGELVELPPQPAPSNGIQRTAKLTLSKAGVLVGEVHEVHLGDSAMNSRYTYEGAMKSTDRIKPVEKLLADSLSSFSIGTASVTNVEDRSLPFIWDYSFQSNDYAKFAGDMLLVRPHVLGKDESGILETQDPRKYAIEFNEGPHIDADTFEITLPQGYVVDDIPSPVDVDYDFASYHSKTEVVGNVLRYHRTFEEKELSVPVSKADQLKKFYRIIASDERNTAVLKLQAQ